MTQNEWLLNYFKSGRTLTTLRAHQHGVCRLSERCREIEKKGHKIKRTPKQVGSRFGCGKVRVVEYGIGR